MAYKFKEIEEKWLNKWVNEKTFKTDVEDFSKPKYYVLDMFPYPSGSGLHVGHVEGYTATDALARFKRSQGFNVLHPIGFDSFGLPAEQFAIQNNKHPGEFTQHNIDNFITQLKRCGFSYDWDRVIITSNPDFYKYTQEIFTKLYKKKLAYYDDRPVNFCPALGTVLANEEVVDGFSERGHHPVIRMNLKQWVLKITAYADKLLEDMGELDWPSSTLEMQRNWIGKSTGCEVTFTVDKTKLKFDVFTTRVDTLYGCTYVVLAPEHPLVSKITSKEQEEIVNEYIKQTQSKSDLQRTELNKDKTGVFTGAYAINPMNNKKIPIYIGDYVLASYGTGAVMAVPAHDQRDYEFAKKHNLPMIQVLEGDISSQAYVEDGVHINSDIANGLNIEQAKEAISNKLVELKKGRIKTNFKLRDWLFSRQRYWGEPIPIVHMKDGSIHVLSKKELPLELPKLKKYAPSGDGSSPLSTAKSWLKYEYKGMPGKRETNTMPQWAGSSWYYARFIDPKNAKEIGRKELLDHWLPVDTYIGGTEHSVLHLLYARFWHKFLHEQGVFASKEPFKRLFHQGMILGTDGNKMSKSAGNTVNPLDVIDEVGSDALRLYEMFKGPLDQSLPWNPSGTKAAFKFIDRVYRLYNGEANITIDDSVKMSKEMEYVYNFTIKKVTEDYEILHFNTAISQIMIFVNEIYKQENVNKEILVTLCKLLNPITPCLASECYNILTSEDNIEFTSWPKYDETKLVKDEVTYAVSVNGKLRATLVLKRDLTEEEIEQVKKDVLNLEEVKKYTEAKEIRKIIVVKNKIINIVI